MSRFCEVRSNWVNNSHLRQRFDRIFCHHQDNYSTSCFSLTTQLWLNLAKCAMLCHIFLFNLTEPHKIWKDVQYFFLIWPNLAKFKNMCNSTEPRKIFPSIIETRSLISWLFVTKYNTTFIILLGWYRIK